MTELLDTALIKTLRYENWFFEVTASSACIHIESICWTKYLLQALLGKNCMCHTAYLFYFDLFQLIGKSEVLVSYFWFQVLVVSEWRQAQMCVECALWGRLQWCLAREYVLMYHSKLFLDSVEICWLSLYVVKIPQGQNCITQGCPVVQETPYKKNPPFLNSKNCVISFQNS